MSTESIKLSELTQRIKGVLENEIEQTWIIAEISELRENQSGHCYLELIEKDNNSEQIVSKIRAVIWSYTYRMLKPFFETSTGYDLSDGIKVLVKVKVNFHDVFGLSLDIKDIDPSYTIGDIELKRQKIIQQLTDEGVISMNKELAFPILPKRIAIISSASAAGYEDFVNQIENNDYGYKFSYKLFNAFMQGNNAEQSIIDALDEIYNKEHLFDVVIIVRGGGAKADLSYFDSYWLAYNITQFPLPVISGIGHERDETIVDIVSHTKMKTPTAAADFMISIFSELENNLMQQQDLFSNLIKNNIANHNNYLQKAATDLVLISRNVLNRNKNSLQSKLYKFQNATAELLSRSDYKLNVLQQNTKQITNTIIRNNNTDIDNKALLLKSKVKQLLQNKQNSLEIFENKNNFLNPEKLLKRGYSVTYHNNKVVKYKNEIKEGDIIETHLKNGKIKSVVK